ncbi:Corticotropin-releasing factor receptor 2 [Nibea albiflora]|uniref:Corticotropin-releasing factor receptor 2 n=1 Tax=Nibea albiflora TaxID=240163 RepID=A0ACB7FJN3_NIBAL|nr:Corticotropin-releasing factor receptor 2 [Nibea albiflora]
MNGQIEFNKYLKTSVMFATMQPFYCFLNRAPNSSLAGSAYRECLDNGTWALKSNYSNCEPILEEKRKYPMHYKIALIINYLGHCISVGALVVAFILFLCLRQHGNDACFSFGLRHRSIRCLRNIIHWNLITTFILRNVMWFLLQLIDHNIHESNEINFVFLFNIVRILMTKLRASTTSETIQYRKAVKATLVLLPLLGITYMLFFVNPGEDDISQIVFIYFNSFLQSFQVRSAVRKRWHRWQDNHALRVRVARAMSIPTSPTRISFHSIKQTTAV